MKPILIILLLTAFLLPLKSLTQITAAENGLTKEVGSTDVLVKLGGTLYNVQTSIDFGSGSSSAFLFKKGSSNYFYLGNNGNIGIGTNAPSAKLHLAGSFLLVDGSQGAGKVLTSDANGLASWQTPSGGGTSPWTISTNDISNNNSGNVGIGTSSPNAKLHINGSFRLVDGTQGAGKVLTSDANGVASWQTASGGSSQWTTSGNNIYSNNSGNVGIGVSSPLEKLHITGNLRLEINNTNTPIFTAYKNGYSFFEIRSFGDYDGSYSSIYIGKDAGKNYNLDNLDDANIGIGWRALYSNVVNDRNLAIGNATLYALTSGSGNTALGGASLMSITAGNSNTGIGYAALGYKTSGSNNTSLGTYAGFYNASGSANTFIGDNSGLQSTGSGNAFFGKGAGQNIGAGNYNVIIGSNNGSSLTGLNNHILIADGLGYERLKINSNGAYRIGDSYGSPGQVLTSNGYDDMPEWRTISSGGASQWTTSGNNIHNNNSGNVGIGISSPLAKLHIAGGVRLETNNTNTPIFTAYTNGYSHLEIRAFGDGSSSSIYIGKDAGKNYDLNYMDETNNIGIGWKALYSNISGSKNVAIGTFTLSALTTGYYNTALGHYSLNQITTGGGNTGIGDAVLANNTSGGSNTGLGMLAGVYNISGNGNTFIGVSSGFRSTGSGNTFIGKDAGALIYGGNYNVILGGNDGWGIAGLNNHIIIADGQGNERLKINNSGAYYVGSSYGTSGQVLTSNGTGGAPTWQTVSGSGGGFWTDAGSGNLYNTTQAGTVAIGLSAVPSGYKLAVAGNIIAEKIKTKLQASGWPDFVFQPDYNLPSLKEVEQFIKENNHLPGVPSAKEIEKDGLDLGDGQATLLKKVEELTLYMIEMNKQIVKLNEENKELKKQIAGKK